MVTSPSELDPVETVLLTEFHMPEILSMWPIKKDFGSVGHILVVNRLPPFSFPNHRGKMITNLQICICFVQYCE